MIAMSDEIDKLAAALAAAQGEMLSANKATKGNFGHYADLDACWAAARGPLSKNGLSVTQWPTTDGARVTITTMLLHASGQYLQGSVTLKARDDSPQAVGSAVTYGKRYGFSAAIGLTADKDDDGQASQDGSGTKGSSNGNGNSAAKKNPTDHDYGKPSAAERAKEAAAQKAREDKILAAKAAAAAKSALATEAPLPPAQPAIFDKDNQAQVKWLHAKLVDDKLSQEVWPVVVSELHAKPFTEHNFNLAFETAKKLER